MRTTPPGRGRISTALNSLTGAVASPMVADKYQTGFDKPLLHTMYVHKRLDGIQAIQTLSRLNGTTKGKEDTFVLDFANDAEDIQQAFQPYFEDTTIGEDADVHQLYQLQHDLTGAQVFYAQEVEHLCEVFFRARLALSKADNGLLYSIVDKAVPRFEALAEQPREQFRVQVGAFRSLFGFLSQVIPFQDSDLEKLYTYLCFLEIRLPEGGSPIYDFDDDVQLRPRNIGLCEVFRRKTKWATSARSMQLNRVKGVKVTTCGRLERTMRSDAVFDAIMHQ